MKLSGCSVALSRSSYCSPCQCLYAYQRGLGQYDLNQIEVRGYRIADVKKPYQLHKDIEQELLWRGPMTELPPKLG